MSGTTAGISNTDLGLLSFLNASNALIYTNNSTPLIFGTFSNERMRIDSSGNVGIGTTSPSGMLHVDGGASNAAAIFLTGDSGNANVPRLRFNRNGASGNQFALRDDKCGRR